MLLYKLFMNTKKVLSRAGVIQDLVMGRNLWRARSASLYWGSGGFAPSDVHWQAPGGGQEAKPPEADEVSANETLFLMKLISNMINYSNH